MITRRGVGLLIIAIVGFFVASATRVGWLHMADAVLAGTLVVSAVLPQMAVAKLGAEAKFAPRRRSNADIAPVVGDPADFGITLHNRAPFPRLFVAATVRVAQTSGQAAARFFVAHVPARSSARMNGDVVCGRRGWQSVDQITVECRAPFGLFRARRRPAVNARLLVYPIWFPLHRLKLLDALGGEHAGRRPARRGEEVAGSRRYVAGDAMRDMHWKNTARTGRPTVKEFDAGIEESLTFAFETGAVLGEAPESTLEYAITIAASVGKVILGRGGEVQFALGGAGRDIYYDWVEVMRRLALVQRSTLPVMADALRNAEPGSRVLAVVSAAHHADVEAVAAAACRGVAVAAIVLEGFTSADSAAGALKALSAAGVPAVVCRRGQMAQGMDAIERGVVARTTEHVA